MNEMFEKQLIEKYPRLYRYAGWNNLSSSLMGFGFNHDDGWYCLIDELSGVISNYLDLLEKSDRLRFVRKFVRRLLVDSRDIPTKFSLYLPNKICSILEKFSSRTYLIFKVEQVKEKFGTLRYYVYGADKTIEDIISHYEWRSHKICDSCGQEGDYDSDFEKNPITTNGSGWITTKCQRCRKILAKEKI